MSFSGRNTRYERRDSSGSDRSNRSGGGNSNIKCYNCGKMGHRQRDCRSKRAEPRYRDSPARSRSDRESGSRNQPRDRQRDPQSGESGKSSGEQKEKGKGRQSSSDKPKKEVKCYTCGQTGHISPRCPNRSPSSESKSSREWKAEGKERGRR